MKKFDFSDTIQKIQESFGKDKSRADQFGLGNSLETVSLNSEDHVVLPEWWKDQYGVLGLPFGRIVQLSGKPDSGKTSLCLLAMRHAQEQGHGIVYVETEMKTTEADFISAGIDPKGVVTISSNLTEEVFSGLNTSIDAFFDDYPDAKLLCIIDSYGNTSSIRDSEIDMTQKTAMVGGAAKSNRLGLGAIRARQNNHPIALLIINYEYANLGFGHGTTNAGGRALEFFCSLIIQAARKGWIERTQKGVKVRAGAEVVWKTSKNHFAKSLVTEGGKPILLPKEIILKITAEGIIPAKETTK